MDGVIILNWRNTYNRDYLEAAPDTSLRIHYRPLVSNNNTSRHYKAEPRQPWRVLQEKLEPTKVSTYLLDVYLINNLVKM